MPCFIFIGSQHNIETVALSMAIGFLVLFIPNWWYLVRYMTGASLKEFVGAAVPSWRMVKKLKS
jgi:uncharacterized membrane protein